MRLRSKLAGLLSTFISIGCAAEAQVKPVVAIPAPAPEPREEIVDCAHSLDTEDGPVCVAPIDEVAQKWRAESERFFVKAGRVVRIEYRKGAGLLQGSCAVAELSYDPGRHLEKRTCFLGTGRVHDVATFSEGSTKIVTVDDRGRPMFGGRNDCPLVKQELDASGHYIARRCFDERGAPRNNDWGVHELRYQRDARGIQVEVSLLDAQGRPSAGTEGFARKAMERTPTGGIKSERFFDAGGKPVALKGSGAALIRNELDRWGNRTSLRFFGEHEEPVATTAFPGRDYKYDELGNVAVEVTLDVAGHPLKNKEGWATLKRSYDKRGYVAESVFLDEAGIESTTSRFQYGETGLLIRRDDFKGAAAKGIVTFSYDPRGNLIKEVHSKPSGAPMQFSGQAVALLFAYDDRDRLKEKVFVDAAYLPVPSKDGAAIVRYGYGESNVRTEEILDAHGQALVRFGARHLLVQFHGAMRAPASITRTRDEARLRAEEARKKALKGAPFDDLVTTYSDEPDADRKGDLGHFYRGTMVPKFQDALEATKIGAVSEVVETPFGFHVILRTE